MDVSADLLQERFLASLRDRVAWQAREAERRRALAAPAPVDVRDIASLRSLVAGNRGHVRAREWDAFLDELEVLTDDAGMLPAQLESLVRVVLADLLP